MSVRLAASTYHERRMKDPSGMPNRDDKAAAVREALSKIPAGSPLRAKFASAGNDG